MCSLQSPLTEIPTPSWGTWPKPRALEEHGQNPEHLSLCLKYYISCLIIFLTMKQPCPYTDTLWSINIIFYPEEFLHMTLPLPPPPLLIYINVHRTTCTSVSRTMLYQRPQDHLHVCILYNALTMPHNHHYYTSVSTGPPPCLCLIQSSHKAPQPPLLCIRQRPLEHLHIRVSYNALTRPHNGSHGP